MLVVQGNANKLGHITCFISPYVEMKQSYFLSKTDVARDQEHLQYITFRNDHLWPCPETLAQ